MLRTDFDKLEENHSAVQVNPKLLWLPSMANFGVIIARAVNSIAAYWV